MNKNNLRIIRYDDLPLGGFAGVMEKRMVLNPDMWPEAKDRTGISHGLGDFIYLANGYFKPNEGVPIHPHKDVDIVSLILTGNVGHKGSMGDGTVIDSPGLQVQRAGTGMEHSEFNTGDDKAEIIQMWFRPPENGLEPSYQSVSLSKGSFITVLGGNDGERFNNHMTCKIGYELESHPISLDEECIGLVTGGSAKINGVGVSKGDLFEANSIEITNQSALGVVLIHKT